MSSVHVSLFRSNSANKITDLLEQELDGRLFISIFGPVKYFSSSKN